MQIQEHVLSHMLDHLFNSITLIITKELFFASFHIPGEDLMILINVCKAGIFSVKFCNELHIDFHDHKSCSKVMLQELWSVFENVSLRCSAISQQACALYDLVDEYDALQPMACCYCVPTNIANNENLQVHCYFPISTLGVANCLFNHLTNIFLGV